MYAGSLPHFLPGRRGRLLVALAVALFLIACALLGSDVSVANAAAANPPDNVNIFWPYRW
jgi:hypothetical protein